MARVLVIDDCGAFRSALRFILEGEGFEVLEARDALAGLQRAVEDDPDVVMVASELEGLGGVEVAARIALEPSTRTLPVFVSHDCPAASLARGVAAVGGRGVFDRSARGEEIVSLIREALWPIASSTPALGESVRVRL